MAQKLIVNEKVVQDEGDGTFETKLKVSYKNVSITHQIKFRQKGRGQCPGAPGYPRLRWWLLKGIKGTQAPFLMFSYVCKHKSTSTL